MLQLDEITSPDDMETLRQEWSALWDRCPSATPFQSPEWLCAWWRQFGNRTPFLITLRMDRRLVGVAPFFLYCHQDGSRRVAFIGSGISDYLDVLLEPAFAQEGTREFLGHLARRSELWDLCHFEELRPDSPLLSRLHIPGLELRADRGESCSVLRLPASIEAFRNGLSVRSRGRLRRVQVRLRADDLQFEIADADSLPEFLDSLFRLHSAAWERKDMHGVLLDPRVRGFHREVSSALMKRGVLRLMALRMQGKCIAAIYCFASRETMYGYLTGFDPDAARYSPGRAILCLALEQAIREGIREFDFLRGEEDYKTSWGPRISYNFRLRIDHAESGS